MKHKKLFLLPVILGMLASCGPRAPESSSQPRPTSEPTPTSQPAQPTSEPTPTSQPAAPTSEPAPQTSEPAPETSEPAIETSEPAPQTSEPAPETSEPIPQTSEPEPEPSSMEPATSETPSVGTSEAPVVSSFEPDSSEGPVITSEPTSEPSSLDPSSEPLSSSEEEEPASDFNGVIRIYFHNDNGTEASKAIYVWTEGADGKEYDWTGEWTEGGKHNGMYFDMDISVAPYAGTVSSYISFIIKNPGTWSGQSADAEVELAPYLDKITTHPETGKQMISVYSCFGEGTAIETYSEPSDVLGDYFKSFAAKDWNNLVIEGSGPVANYKVYAFDEVYLKMTSLDKSEHREEYVIATGEPNQATITIPIQGGVDPHITYQLVGSFATNLAKSKKKVATFDKLYDTEKFVKEYTYSGKDLGATYYKDRTEFRVWSPVSSAVMVKIYRYGTPSSLTDNPSAHGNYDSPRKRVYLTKQEGGVFSGTITGDLHGQYYTYTLYYNDAAIETIDPYAKACGLNSVRGAILDPERTNPEGWDDLSFQTHIGTMANMLTPYEVSVRDFTSRESWISNEGNKRSTFNAFVESGTTYNGVKTGYDHLEELGVNAVQLQPISDAGNDERDFKLDAEGNKIPTTPAYNWNYNPQNFFCVDGVFASNAEDALTRVKEFKNLILRLSEIDIRVVMDIVLNHVSSLAKSPLTAVCPRYFFLFDENMNLIDDSGCGNTTYSQRYMMSRLCVDVIEWWTSFYKVKGFRFDLMGCIDSATIRQCKDIAYDVDPEIVLYGEGWSLGEHTSYPANTWNTYARLGDNGKGVVGCFNDCGRDGAKGNTSWGSPAPASGWLTNGSNVDNVYDTLTMVIGENRHIKSAQGLQSMDPRQTLNFLACHDNYTLYDQINYQFYNHDKSYGDPNHEAVMKACVGLSSLVLFGQGIAFIHGGDEMFRQKIIRSDNPLFEALKEVGDDGIEINQDAYLVRNSYRYGDDVNGFDWARKTDPMVNRYYKKFAALCQLRRQELGNALGQTEAQIKNNGCTCWSYNDLFEEVEEEGGGKWTRSKTDLLAAFCKGQKDGSTNYIFLNKGNVDNAEIGIGNGTYQVLYSSTGTHSGQMKITDNKVRCAKFEALIVRQVA